MFPIKHVGLPAILLVSMQAPAQAQTATDLAVSDAKAFMASYAEDLIGGKREALINRYDSDGHYQVGEGQKAYMTSGETRILYTTKWTPPASFAWRDLSYEAVGKDAVLVTGLFDWGISADLKLAFSYTSLLVRRNGVLKIRLENESRALPAAKPDSNSAH